MILFIYNTNNQILKYYSLIWKLVEGKEWFVKITNYDWLSVVKLKEFRILYGVVGFLSWGYKIGWIWKRR